jgi:hypothetical protein
VGNVNESIVCFGCLHAPFQHRDSIPFLLSVKEKFKIKRAICTGDEADKHSENFHTHDPDLLSSGSELEETINHFKYLRQIFPKLELTHSNHGSMILRKMKHSGLSSRYLKNLSEIYETPGWTWNDNIIIKMNNGKEIEFRHQFEKDVKMAANRHGKCVVQSHFHTDFQIRYTSNSSKANWGASTGCLLDNESMAFEYNKTQKEEPVLGCLVIVDCIPQLVPMLLNEKKRWVGKL